MGIAAQQFFAGRNTTPTPSMKTESATLYRRSSTKRSEESGFAARLKLLFGNSNEFSRRVTASSFPTASIKPGDLWIYNLRSQRADQLSFSAIASLRATPLRRRKLSTTKALTGKLLPALLWMPFNLKRDVKIPPSCYHTRPTGQMVDYWNTDVAALTSRGYICIAPTRAVQPVTAWIFKKANFQDLGGGDLKDEIAGVDFSKPPVTSMPGRSASMAALTAAS